MKEKKIIFISGSGRSRTTILKKIFSRHPNIGVGPEWRFLIDPGGIIDFYNSYTSGWSPFHFDVSLRRLFKTLNNTGKNKFLSNLFRKTLNSIRVNKKLPYKFYGSYAEFYALEACPDYFKLVNRLKSDLVAFKFKCLWTGQSLLQETALNYQSPNQIKKIEDVLGSFLMNIYASVLKKSNAYIYMDDNTWSFLWLDKIIKLIPEVRLIHIYRDPRDVVSSYSKQNWAPNDPKQAAILYYDLMTQWQQIKTKIPETYFREISLENLINNPGKVLGGICDFFDIPWHNSLLETDLSQGHCGRWKKDLSKEVANDISSILYPYLDKFGYLE